MGANLPEVITIGEMLVEVMHKDADVSLGKLADFVGAFPSGAPAIFIDAVARLGKSAGIIGSVGCDEFGECILERLGKDGVDTSGVKKIREISTGVAFVAYFSDGSRKFIYHMSNSAAGAIDVSDLPKNYIESASVIHISGSSLAMGENMRETCYEAIKTAKKAGALVSFDPNVRTELLGANRIREVVAPVLESSNLLIPSVNELKEICGIDREEKAAEEVIEGGVDIVAVKDGKRGCRIYTKDKKVECPAFDMREIDPTGAGDAFSAAIVVGWLEKMSPEKLAVFANAVGGKAVTAKGPMEGLPWRDEADEMVNKKISTYTGKSLT